MPFLLRSCSHDAFILLQVAVYFEAQSLQDFQCFSVSEMVLYFIYLFIYLFNPLYKVNNIHLIHKYTNPNRLN